MAEQTAVDVLSAGRVRVTDAERREAEERLRQGLSEGSLDLAEFEQRVTRLWQDVRTREDLAGITADLPVPVVETQGLQKPRAVWLTIAVLNCLAWLIVFVTTASMDQFSWQSVDVAQAYLGWTAIIAGSGSLIGVWWATGFGRRRKR